MSIQNTVAVHNNKQIQMMAIILVPYESGLVIVFILIGGNVKIITIQKLDIYLIIIIVMIIINYYLYDCYS